MPLRPISELLHAAQVKGYALGYFESWNLESLLGVLDAAEKTHSPILIGFNGEFLTNPERILPERIALYGALGKAAADAASIPCGLVFNECPIETAVYQAIHEGFNLVMLSDPVANSQLFIDKVAALSHIAHSHGVAVEAELGELPNGESGSIDLRHSSLTDPYHAARFVASTGIDCLSVSVGNVHVMVEGSQELNFDLLQEIHRLTPIPLGLHGGSGISRQSLQKAISLGIAKVNFGTYLKQAYINALRSALGDTKGTNPHRLLGMGGADDLLGITRTAICQAVLERIDLLGCSGRA